MGQEEPLEKEMATHSSILAWRIPRREEPGGLQSTGSGVFFKFSEYSRNRSEIFVLSVNLLGTTIIISIMNVLVV